MVGPSVNPHSLSLKPIKLTCSYGGRILPRYPDGKLRYHGGETRVLSVDRSISFSELLVKLCELCGTPVSLRCQLPTEDLDALVSITSDEDLTNIIEEYDRAAAAAAAPPSPSPLKIRAFLYGPRNAARKVSPPISSASSSSSNDAMSPKSALYSAALPPRSPTLDGGVPFFRRGSRPPAYPAGKVARHQYAHGSNGQCYLIHNGGHFIQ